MNKELNVGDEVLVFERKQLQDYEQYIEGNVIKKEMSDDLSYHGSPWYVINYTVLGEDGIEYFGNYGSPILGDNFFMTRGDYINFLEKKLLSNHEKILNINEENQIIEKMIEIIQKKETNKLIKRK